MAVSGGSCAMHAAYLEELSKVWHICAHAYLTKCGLVALLGACFSASRLGAFPEKSIYHSMRYRSEALRAACSTYKDDIIPF